MTPAERLDLVRDDGLRTLELARLVSLASRIPPALIRRARLHHLTGAGPSTESAFWFGPLVEFRQSDTVTLFPDVASSLRANLAADGRLLGQAHDLLKSLPAISRAPLIEIEDKLILGGIDVRARAEAEDCLHQVIVAIHEEERRGLWRWALGLPRRIPEIASWSSTTLLYALAHQRLFGAEPPREKLGAPLNQAERGLLLSGHEHVRVGVRQSGGVFASREPPHAGDVVLDVPDGEWRVIDLLPGTAGGSSTGSLVQWPSRARGANGNAELPLTLVTIDGARFDLTNRQADVERLTPLVSRHFVTIHAADGSEVGVGWLARNGLILTAASIIRKAQPRNGRVGVRFPYLMRSTLDGTVAASSGTETGTDTPVIVRLLQPQNAAPAEISSSGTLALPAVPSVLRNDLAPHERWWRFTIGEDNAIPRRRLGAASLMSEGARSGCVGAPVVDPATGNVLGMYILDRGEPVCLTWPELVRLLPALEPPKPRSQKPTILVIYSHRDEPDRPGDGEIRWLSFVQSFLAPAVRSGIFQLWVDRDIPAGQSWRDETENKLATCDVCVLLLSRHVLASAYIMEVELPRIVERAKQRQLHLVPILLTPVPDSSLTSLRDFALRPRNGRALSDFSRYERDRQMAEIVDEIAEIAQTVPSSLSELLPPIPPTALLDITHLPEPAYERLVGRESDLNRLDEGWADGKTNILSLVGEGGAGKSALLNEWLKGLRIDGYRGAEVVLGWSFYSQGTKERATSAEQFLNWTAEKLGIRIETTSATAKGEAIAEEMIKRRVLLVLDGCEPLQHGLDKQQGELKDQGLRALLRRFAAAPTTDDAHGLIVVTSRLAVKDIARWQDSVAPVVHVDRLSDGAGAALLRDNGVWGVDRELEAAARDLGGHPLALGLLASYLKETQWGDVRRRDRIRGLLHDEDNPRHDHARRVMESYQREWFSNEPILHSIMCLVGLFDRPASGDSLKALRGRPAIEGLTDQIINLSDSEWQRAIARLREARLLAPQDPAAPEALDAHPLIREWFGVRLRQLNESALRSGHGRLYEHLRDTAREGTLPTLEDLAPLYQAIGHGCLAGRYAETLDEIYIDRICRRTGDGQLQFYAERQLGAIGSNLSAISWFFERPFETLASALSVTQQAWILSQAGLHLRAQGRLAEALPTQRAALNMATNAGNLADYVLRSIGLTESQLIVGEIAGALSTASSAVETADRIANLRLTGLSRANQANALEAAGRLDEAERVLVEPEKSLATAGIGRQIQDAFPMLRYGGLLLARGKWEIAREQTALALRDTRSNTSLLELALGRLILGQAHLGAALMTAADSPSLARDARSAAIELAEAVDRLRMAAQSDATARGLLSRASLRRAIGDWQGFARDIDEVEEIAEPAPMRLHLCDVALQYARVAFARIEAFAPLNGFLESENSPKPQLPDKAEAAGLREEAAKQLAIAADYVASCGYHRRDEELAELQAALRGERTFASLPPRL